MGFVWGRFRSFRAVKAFGGEVEWHWLEWAFDAC